MKATVNGIEIEGTPDEIAKFTEIMERKRRPAGTHEIKFSNSYTKSCTSAMNGGCYCTGACQT